MTLAEIDQRLANLRKRLAQMDRDQDPLGELQWDIEVEIFALMTRRRRLDAEKG